MAVWWHPDPELDRDLSLDCSKALHRICGRLGYYTSPKKSHISRGNYYAEINEHYGAPNVAIGTGRTPLEAALDGYRKVVERTPLFRIVALECEVQLLREAVQRREAQERYQAKLDAKLESALGLLSETIAKL